MGKLFGGGSKAPAPTDPSVVLGAQDKYNQAGEQRQLGYNRLNQYGPFGGSVTFGPGGVTKSLGDAGDAYAQGLSGLGQRYFQGANDLLQNRPDLSSNAAFDRAYETASANLEPRFERTRAGAESRLRNQGLDPTSESYKSAMNDLALQQNEARNNLVTGLQGQLFNQGLQARNQNVNDLLGLSQPGIQFSNNVLNEQMPSYNPVSVGNVNAQGAYDNAFNQQMALYNAQQARQNAMWGGLGAIGGTALRYGLPLLMG